MYGDDKKEAFIKEYLRSKVIIETSLYAIFKKVRPFEIKLDKDVSEFTREEILSMIKAFRSKSVNSILNYIVVLKHYSRWITGTVGDNAYEDIGKQDVIDLVDKNASSILTRDDIDEIEEQLLNWSDKAIIELFWEGIAGPSMTHIYNLSTDNVDFDNGIIVIDNTIYPLTDNLRYLLPKAFAENEIMSYGETLRLVPVHGIGRIYKERANSLGSKTKDACFRYFYRKIRIFRDYLDIPGLTMKDLQSSGLLHYIQLGMKETNMSMREFLKTKQGEELGRRYGFGDYWVDNITAKYNQYE